MLAPFYYAQAEVIIRSIAVRLVGRVLCARPFISRFNRSSEIQELSSMGHERVRIIASFWHAHEIQPTHLGHTLGLD